MIFKRLHLGTVSFASDTVGDMMEYLASSFESEQDTNTKGLHFTYLY